MKEKKIKQKEIEDKAQKLKSGAFALYNFPYYNSSLNYFWLYPVKALLACFSAAFGIVYFAQLLNFDRELFSFAAAAFIACGVYYVLLGFFKGPPVAAVTLCGLSLYCFAAAQKLDLAVDFNGFLNRYMLTAKGYYISTSNFFGLETAEGSVRFMILISIVFGIIFAFCTAKRYHPDVIFVFSAALAVPGFLSSNACFYPSLAIFAAGLLAIWAMNQSMGAAIILSSGGAINMKGSDKKYRRSIKKLSPSAKAITDGKRYTKYLSDGIIIFTVAAVTMNIVASAFPQNGSVKFDKIIQKAIALGQEIGEHFTGFFTDLDISFGGKSYLNGFFSADGKNINISNSINPNSGNRKGVPVIEVTTENKDKLYLRGDIGYDFDGDNWKSIAKIDYSSLKYGPSYMDWGFEGEVYIKDVFDNYVPEIQMLYARSRKSFLEDGGEAVNPIGIETVKIDYLKNLNTVLFPGTPFVYNFRENNNFKIYGDFVGILEGRRINSMETGVLYVNRPVDVYNNYYDENYYDDYLFYQLETSLTLEKYRRYKYAYEMFIYEHYATISSEHKALIDSFARECMVNLSIDYYREHDFQSQYCDNVMNCLNSGKYTYSLTADNFSSETDSPLYTFLYNTREGHCAMFATAMCLALRYQGIPARYVTGFTLGGDNCEQVDAGHYKYTLTDKDLHAWVEVYYKDLGWVPYDPTPGSIEANTVVTAPATQQNPTTTPPAEEITTTAPSVTTAADNTGITTTTVQSGENTQATATAVTENRSDAPPLDSEAIRIILIIFGTALTLFILFMTALGFYKKLGRKQRELLNFFRKGDPTKAVKAMLPFMLRLLAVKGIVRSKGETPEEFGLRADKQLNLTDAVKTTIPIFEKSEFDKNPAFGAEEQQTAYACITTLLRDLLEGMKPYKRLAARIKLFGVNRKK